MSITFYASTYEDSPICRHCVPLFRCDCMQRWADACDACGPDDELPELESCEHCRAEVNVANSNGLDLLAWLGLEPDYCGTVAASDLAARCRRRLWDESRNHDPVLTGVERAEQMGVQLSERIIICDRRPGYLRDQTERLLALAEKAGDQWVSWG
jgi:hypothetical protein